MLHLGRILMLDPNVNRELMTTYILKKFVPMLKEPLLFAQFGQPVAPVPWYRRRWFRIRNYFANLWLALKGQIDD